MQLWGAEETLDIVSVLLNSCSRDICHVMKALVNNQMFRIYYFFQENQSLLLIQSLQLSLSLSQSVIFSLVMSKEAVIMNLRSFLALLSLLHFSEVHIFYLLKIAEAVWRPVPTVGVWEVNVDGGTIRAWLKCWSASVNAPPSLRRWEQP